MLTLPFLLTWPVAGERWAWVAPRTAIRVTRPTSHTADSTSPAMANPFPFCATLRIFTSATMPKTMPAMAVSVSAPSIPRTNEAIASPLVPPLRGLS